MPALLLTNSITTISYITVNDIAINFDINVNLNTTGNTALTTNTFPGLTSSSIVTLNIPPDSPIDFLISSTLYP